MKQIVQDLKNGDTLLIDAPKPNCPNGRLLIRTQSSLVSAGTERMLVGFGKSGWLAKARSQPDKVRQVLAKIQTDGLLPTYRAVSNKLDKLVTLGYCNVGKVVEANGGQFIVGDRVVSNGCHAELVCVPSNLCAVVPANVSSEEAAFTVLGSVALQSVRLLEPTLGETFVVTGLGLVGLIAVQILRANGCQVIGLDFNPSRLEMAKSFGAEVANLGDVTDVVRHCRQLAPKGVVDGVLVATATQDNSPVSNAAQMCRQRGRVVLVGVAGLDLSRADFYEKEISFRVSCSYGPGRYDRSYEERGNDYPIGFVRWTEQRNFEAILNLMSQKLLNVEPMISHRFEFNDSLSAYELLASKRPALGIVLKYDSTSEVEDIRTVQVETDSKPSDAGCHLGVIGAGNYTTGVILPALVKSSGNLKVIASHGGTSAALAARRFGIQEATSDVDSLLKRDEVNAIVISTRHNTHASLAISALESGKHVFVEKPAAMDMDELKALRGTVASCSKLQFMVGFNRRFSVLTEQLKHALLGRIEPINIIYTVNAGALEAGHWAVDSAVGGGRIIGEACHFIDLARFLVDRPIVGTTASGLGVGGNRIADDTTISLEFEDGSKATVHYITNGAKQFAKERVEVFSQSRVATIDNFRSLRWYGWSGQRNRKLLFQDKGQAAQFELWTKRVAEGGAALIPWSEIEEVTKASFLAAESSSE